MHGPIRNSWSVRWRESESAAGASWAAAAAPLRRGRYVPCATAGGGWHAGRCVAAGLVEGKAEEGWHVLVGTASSKATQRNATCNAAGRAIRREAGQRGRATRLPGESQGVDVGSGCELTPSTVLAEVSSSRRAPRRPCEGPSCYKLHVAELLLHNHPSHTRAITRAVHCGSFASIPLICRQSEREKQAIASHNSLLETSITTCLARRPRAPRHTSGTSRRLFRNRESERTKSASVAGGPGDFAIISLARPPSPSLLPPFRAPFLPPSLSPSATVSQGIRKYPSAHTQTWKCICLLRNYFHHQTLRAHLHRRNSFSSPPSSDTASDLRSRCNPCCHVISVTPVHSAACLPTRLPLASATCTDCIQMHELFISYMTADWSNV